MNYDGAFQIYNLLRGMSAMFFLFFFVFFWFWDFILHTKYQILRVLGIVTIFHP